MRKWRSKPTKYLATRAITKEEYPKLIEAMKEDGLIAIITAEGIKWYHGDYKVTQSVVRGVWNLSLGQMKRIVNYIYSYDPFVSEENGEA
tara:strand:+ start:577 stop:846 length:270 start_codon:yes stop_codon:yes gene_type:complete